MKPIIPLISTMKKQDGRKDTMGIDKHIWKLVKEDKFYYHFERVKHDNTNAE